MRTVIGVNDPQAVKKWSTALGVAVNKSSYFARKMTGMGKDSRLPIQRMDELSSDAGDEITYDLLMPMNMEPVIGDEPLTGKAQPLKYYTDRLRIDQVRGAADLGSRMTRKRTLRDVRSDAKRAATEWWKRLYDELYFIYLSGSRGTTSNGFVWPAGSPFFSVNAVTAPDAMHQMYGGDATSFASISYDDAFDLRLIDKAIAKSETMGGDGSDELSMIPCEIDGEEHYVCLMHTFQFDSLKTSTATGDWLDIQKAATTAQGTKNPIFTGSPGVYSGVILHRHRNVIGFNNAGAGANQPARRALFLGAQAAVLANGSPGTGHRFDWTEEVSDHGNSIEIGTNAIFGVKKATYQSKDGSTLRDFGVIAMDTYAVDPNV
jgi:N4-gp56 family major capsid protein